MCSASIIATLSKFLNILQGEGSANVRHLCQILKMEEDSTLGRQGKNKNFGFLKIHLPLQTEEVLVLPALQRDPLLA